jgi:phosphatidate cytidylyltransferase
VLLFRIITAVILIPVVVCAVLFLPAREAYGVTIVLVAWSAWEWSSVISLEQDWAKWLYVAVLLAIYTVIYWLPMILILGVAACFWMLALLYIMSYPDALLRSCDNKCARYIMGILSILPCWYSVNVLLNADHGHILLMYFLVLVWTADIAAYFAGRQFGQRKLAPDVSPNKSIEGVLGGVLACVVLALLAAWACHLSIELSIGLISISILTALVSVVGDLFMSVKKRIAGLKDMGNLLPGHGGLLDRVDSMMAAAPIFTLSMILVSFT